MIDEVLSIALVITGLIFLTIAAVLSFTPERVWEWLATVDPLTCVASIGITMVVIGGISLLAQAGRGVE